MHRRFNTAHLHIACSIISNNMDTILSKIWIILQISDIFAIKRPKYPSKWWIFPQNYKDFPPKANISWETYYQIPFFACMVINHTSFHPMGQMPAYTKWTLFDLCFLQDGLLPCYPFCTQGIFFLFLREEIVIWNQEIVLFIILSWILARSTNQQMQFVKKMSVYD